MGLASARDGISQATEFALARIYAENRLAASLPVIVLALATAVAATLFVPGLLATGWLAAVLACHAVAVSCSERFLERGRVEDFAWWQFSFAGAEMLLSVAWIAVALAVDPAQSTGSGSFAVFVTLMSLAVTTAIAASLQTAMWAGTLPIVLITAGAWAINGGNESAIVAALACSAGLSFALLGGRLQVNRRQSIELRGEKDALIAELERARANAEEALRRAEDANLAKSRFLATVSHELRTPLNAILGFSEIMESEIMGKHAVGAYRGYATDIHRSGQHLLSLINEILDLSRIEAGRYDLEERELHVADIAGQCAHMMRARAQSAELTLIESFEPTLRPLWAGEKALRQICLNLLSNAIKFTPPDGEVTLKVGWTRGGGQYVSVIDTGPGIPADEIPLVLASFGQGSLARKTAEQGAGLGLPIVRGLVELHGGTLLLRSAPLRGTEAIVTFPADRVLPVRAPVLNG